MADDNNDRMDRFIGSMYKELNANAHKGDWRQLDLGTSVVELHHHVAKLMRALHTADVAAVAEYSADVANCAMFVANAAGCLREEGGPPPSQHKIPEPVKPDNCYDMPPPSPSHYGEY